MSHKHISTVCAIQCRIVCYDIGTCATCCYKLIQIETERNNRFQISIYEISNY